MYQGLQPHFEMETKQQKVLTTYNNKLLQKRAENTTENMKRHSEV